MYVDAEMVRYDYPHIKYAIRMLIWWKRLMHSDRYFQQIRPIFSSGVGGDSDKKSVN